MRPVRGVAVNFVELDHGLGLPIVVCESVGYLRMLLVSCYCNLVFKLVEMGV